MACEDRVPYPSAEVADNAVTLHHLANGEACAGVKAYACGDHWHIGHATREAAGECREHAAIVLEDRQNRRAPRRRGRRRP